MSLHRPWTPAVGARDSAVIAAVTPEAAGWRWAALRVLRLEPGLAHSVPLGEREAFVLPPGPRCPVTAAAGLADGAGKDGA